MSKRNIIIIGAGIGGLATAAGLLQAGLRVRVYERVPSIGEIGAGIMLTPNALRALDVVGALSAVQARAVHPAMSYLRHYKTGEVLGSRSVAGGYQAQYGEPMLTIHRADLHRALVETVRDLAADAIQVNHDFTGFNVLADGRVEARFTNGVVVQADALIGADGIRSNVRAALGLASPPRFTGLVAWRGLAPISRLPAALHETSMNVWVGDGRHIVESTVGEMKDFVAIAHEDWTSESWSTPSSLEAVLEAFPELHPDIASILKATPHDGIVKWALFDRDPLERWSYGPVSLLGDAAHPMLPFMAQGSAMALEDAAVLTRAFADAATVGEVLSRYEAARRQRTSWVQLQSRAAREYYQSTEKRGGHWLSESQHRADVVYTYDAATAPL